MTGAARVLYLTDMKIADVLPLYVSQTCHTESSRKVYRGMLLQLQAQFPGLTLDQFTSQHLTQFCLSGHSPSPATMKARRSRMIGFFGWCQWQGHVTASPAADLKYTVKPGHGGGVVEHCWMDEAQVGHVLQAQHGDPLHGPRARVVLLCGVFLGLRRSEIAGLRWSKFTSDLSRLTFVGKGNKLAQLGVPPQLRTELQQWRREVPVGCQTVLPGIYTEPGTRALAFDWRKPVGGDTISTIVSRAGELGGLRLAPHDLRRTFAGLLEAQGMDIKDISRLMRHSNIGTTSNYLEKNPHRVAGLGDAIQFNVGVG